MKINRTYLIIAISSIAVLCVLLIQVHWMIKTANVKEELFNEKANMVLSKTAAALSADKETCRQMQTCIGENEMNITDSLFSNAMDFYNFKSPYSFEVVKPGAVTSNTNIDLHSDVYKKRLEEEEQSSGLELNLFLPQKKQFILAEMGPVFVTSIILLVVILLLFWQTTYSLLKEKRIAAQTTDFLNNITHELSTPLTNISLAGKMISKEAGVKGESRIQQYSEIILTENEKLKHQVEQVLSINAFERNHLQLRSIAFDAHDIIEKMLQTFNLQLEVKNGKMDVALSAEKHVISGDKEHFAHAICNILDNAIKYSEGVPDLVVSTSNVNSFLKIAIADKGIGIPKEYQKKVFEKYFRVPTGDVHDVKGFGLGLAYVKRVVELHQGKIDLLSMKGNGTMITIQLPCA